MNLEGKVALVPGATGDIGIAASLKLAKKGVELALISRTEEKLRLLRDKIVNNGGKAEYFPCDITNKEQVAITVNAIKTAFGERSYILVNCAGIFEEGTYKDTPIEEVERILETNTYGPLLITKQFLQQIGEPEQVVDVLSHAAYKKLAGNVAYVMSKAAHMGASRSLESEHPKIEVYRIHPGVVDGKMIDRTSFGKNIPKELRVEPEEIGDLVIDLLEGKVIDKEGNQIRDVEIIREKPNITIRKAVNISYEII